VKGAFKERLYFPGAIPEVCGYRTALNRTVVSRARRKPTYDAGRSPEFFRRVARSPRSTLCIYRSCESALISLNSVYEKFEVVLPFVQTAVSYGEGQRQLASGVLS
jgi:hypothetical protein